MSLNCNICNKELDAFSGGRCKVCRTLVCKDCIADGGSQKKGGITCINCAGEAEQANRKEEPVDFDNNDTEAEVTPKKNSAVFIIITAFSLLFIFIYIVAIPYIRTRNALQIVEFGPEEKLSDAKDSLADETGSFVLSELEDMAINGRKNTAIRAIGAIGALPGAKPLLILKQLQANPETPEYLHSVIIEALLEHERRYEVIKVDE